MIFDKNIGSSFYDALKKIKPDLEIRIRQLIENEKSGSNYDVDKIIKESNIDLSKIRQMKN